jgi:hypothetical protein
MQRDFDRKGTYSIVYWNDTWYLVITFINTYNEMRQVHANLSPSRSIDISLSSCYPEQMADVRCDMACFTCLLIDLGIGKGLASAMF